MLEQMTKKSSVMHTTHLETNLNVYTLRYLRYLLFRDDTDYDPIPYTTKSKICQGRSLVEYFLRSLKHFGRGGRFTLVNVEFKFLL